MSNCWHDNERGTRLKFKDVFTTDVDFINAVGYMDPDDYYEGTSKITPVLTEDQTTQCYYLLMSRYNESTFKLTDKDAIARRIGAILASYGAVWAKNKEINQTVRNMSESDIIEGQTSVSNNASNPSIEPSTQTLDELTYIDNQMVNKTKRSKLNAYEHFKDMIDSEKDEWLIEKFKILFIKFPRITEGGYYE